MNDDDVELITGTELTISLRDIVIFEESTRKKGSLAPAYNTSELNVVVEFFISLDTFEIRILH